MQLFDYLKFSNKITLLFVKLPEVNYAIQIEYCLNQSSKPIKLTQVKRPQKEYTKEQMALQRQIQPNRSYLAKQVKFRLDFLKFQEIHIPKP